MKKANRIKIIFLHVLFCLASLIIFLLLTEGLLKIVNFEPLYDRNYKRFTFPISNLVKMGLYVSDQVVFWKMRPYAQEKWYMKEPNDVINSKGMRGREFSTAKPKGGIRILCLGDSHVFGWGVGISDTWPYKLEAMLKRNYPHINWEVINAGISGYSSYQITQFLKTDGIQYNPDIITISQDHHNPNRAIVYSDSGQKEIPSRAINLHYFLVKFRTYRFLRKIIFKFEQNIFSKQRIVRVTPEEYMQNLQKAVALAKLRNIPIIFIESLRFENDSDPHKKYAYIMRYVAEKDDILLVDVTNLWNDINVKEYFLEDMSHPNGKGYEIIASEVYKCLLKNGLLKVN